MGKEAVFGSETLKSTHFPALFRQYLLSSPICFLDPRRGGIILGPSVLYFTRLTVVCRAVSFIARFKLSYNVLDFNFTVQLKVKYEWRYTSTTNTLSRRVQGTTLLYTRSF